METYELPQKKIGPDRFSRLMLFYRNKQTDRQDEYICTLTQTVDGFF